jgi:CubicO group peptidase (beta-lactamase class C family)
MLQHKVRVYNPASVTRVGEEAPDGTTGLRPGLVDRVWRDVVSLYETGLHPAVALCIRHRGEVVLDRTVGHSRGNAVGAPLGGPRSVATPDTLFNLFSATKMVTAMLVHLAAERRLLSVDDPVCRYIPEFAANGKEDITIRHVMTHTAGVEDLPKGALDYEVLENPEPMIRAICDASPKSAPGANVAYHAISGGFLLGEILRRTDGRDVRTMLREEVTGPLGLEDFDYGVPAHRTHEVAEHTFTGLTLPGPIAGKFESCAGISAQDAVTISNEDAFLTGVIPSANLITTPRQATRFLQLLMNGGTLNNQRIFRRETIQAAILERTRAQLDSTFGFPIRYGLGFMLGGRRFSLFGLNTPTVFGHLGFTNVVVWADPERELSVAFLNTGKPFLDPGMLRWYWAMQRLAIEIPRGRPAWAIAA